MDSSLWKEWFAGGVANAVTSALLNPLDVSKTVMQTSTEASSFSSTLKKLYASNGLRGVFLPGLTASVIREMVYSGAKAGMYVPVRNYFSNENGGVTVAAKVQAALLTGALGSLLANPIDVVKIRLMRDPGMYTSTLGALPSIYRAEGVGGLYRGLLPSTLRGACVSAGELASYDIIKSALREKFFSNKDGPVLHVCASLLTGMVASVVAAPWDLIKSRAMSSVGQSASISSVIFQLSKEGGLPFSLFRGLLPAYLRLGPHALVAFPIFEQLRLALGLEYL